MRSLKNEMKKGARIAAAVVLGAVLLGGIGLVTHGVLEAYFPETYEVDVRKVAEQSMIKYDVLGNTGCSATVVAPTVAITAAHCIPHPIQVMQLVMAGLFDPLATPVLSYNKKPLQVLFLNAYQDQAVLVGDFSDKVRALVDDYDGRLYSEQEVVICGFPGNNRKLRCIDSKKLPDNAGFMSKHDSTRIPGESGGAVFAKDGTLIGIIYGVDEQGKSLANTTTGLLSMAKRNLRRQ